MEDALVCKAIKNCCFLSIVYISQFDACDSFPENILCSLAPSRVVSLFERHLREDLHYQSADEVGFLLG